MAHAAVADYTPGSKARLWWPPTDDEDKSDYAGAFWPVQILSVNNQNTTCSVQYDNEEIEQDVRIEHLQPAEPPVDFGDEAVHLQVWLAGCGATAVVAHPARGPNAFEKNELARARALRPCHNGQKFAINANLCVMWRTMQAVRCFARNPMSLTRRLAQNLQLVDGSCNSCTPPDMLAGTHQ